MVERTTLCPAIKFDVSLTAILQNIIKDNIVQTGSFQAVKEDGDTFEIKRDKRGIPYLLKSGEHPNDFKATIFNTDSHAHQVGLGDKDGNSYLTMQVEPDDIIGFQYTPMFAVVPVNGETVPGSMFTSGTTLKPWFLFSLDDVTNKAPSFTYDGMKLLNVSGVKITTHAANEPVFAGGSTKNAEELHKEV